MTSPTRPHTHYEPSHPLLKQALQQALAQAHGIDARSAQPMMAQWLLTLRHALPVAAYWEQTRELLHIVLDDLHIAARIADRIEWLEQGIAASLSHQDEETAAKLQLQLGRERLLQSDIPAATALLRKGMTYFETHKITYPAAFNAQSYIAITLEHYEAAEQWANRALAHLQEEEWIERAHSYRNLGTIAHWTGRFQEALDYHLISLDLWKQSDNPRYIAFGLVNIGSALRALKRYDEANTRYLAAIEIFEQVGDPLNRAFAQANLGNVYLMQEQWALAIEQYHLAEHMFNHSSYRALLGLLYNNWGMAYAGEGRYPRAVRAYERSILLYTELENGQACANSRDNLGLVLMKMGNYTGAIDAFRTALAELPRTDSPAAQKLYAEIIEHIAEAERLDAQSGEQP